MGVKIALPTPIPSLRIAISLAHSNGAAWVNLRLNRCQLTHTAPTEESSVSIESKSRHRLESYFQDRERHRWASAILLQ